MSEEFDKAMSDVIDALKFPDYPEERRAIVRELFGLDIDFAAHLKTMIKEEENSPQAVINLPGDIGEI